MPGILDRMACGVALALAIRGRAKCRRPPTEAKKRLFFQECSMCIKHHKYRQKWPLGGVGLGQGREPKKAKHQQEICFLVIVIFFLMLHFFV